MLLDKQIVKFKVTFEIPRKELAHVLQDLQKSIVLTNRINAKELAKIKLYELREHIPTDEYLALNTLYTRLRKKGYSNKRERFLQDIGKLVCYGLCKLKIIDEKEHIITTDEGVQNIYVYS